MNDLTATTHGRLLCAAISLSLIGGGVAALIGGSIAAIAASPVCIAILCISLIGAIALSMVAVALSIGHEPWFGFLGSIVLPVAMFLYWLALQLAVENQERWGIYGFMALGAVFGVTALRGKDAEAPAMQQTQASAH